MTDAASTEEFTLPARAGVDLAQDLLNAAQAAAESGRLALDASDVEAIDGPAALVIANIARTFAVDGGKVSLKNPPPAFVDAFSDLGLFEDLMKMEFVK